MEIKLSFEERCAIHSAIHNRLSVLEEHVAKGPPLVELVHAEIEHLWRVVRKL